MKRFCLCFTCCDGHKSVLSGSIYNDYNEADKRWKEIQPDYKHRIEVVEI